MSQARSSSESETGLLADPFEFSRRGLSRQGERGVGEFSRLAEMLRPDGVKHLASYTLTGECEGEQSFLTLAVEGTVVLACQRCLGDVACHVASETRFLLVPDGETLPDEDLEEDDFDPIHAGRNLDVLSLVEDELLLALPISPMHEDCEVPGGERHDKAASPFAVLGKLKRS